MSGQVLTSVLGKDARFLPFFVFLANTHLKERFIARLPNKEARNKLDKGPARKNSPFSHYVLASVESSCTPIGKVTCDCRIIVILLVLLATTAVFPGEISRLVAVSSLYVSPLCVLPILLL